MKNKTKITELEAESFVSFLSNLVPEETELKRFKEKNIRQNHKTLNVDIGEIINITEQDLIEWNSEYYQKSEETKHADELTLTKFLNNCMKLTDVEFLVLKARAAQVLAIYKTQNERVFTNEMAADLLSDLLELEVNLSGKAYEKRAMRLEQKLGMSIESLIYYRIIC